MAIGTDSFEGESYLRQYKERNGFPWPIAAVDSDVIESYEVVVRSTKFGIDRNGVIVLKGLYGTQPFEEWERWLKQLEEG